MLDLYRLRDQFPDFSAYQFDEQVRAGRRREQAAEALADCADGWEALAEAVRAKPPKWLVAGLRASPAEVGRCGPRPTPLTVVATDGSQIYPDRHVEPACYLLNVSRIAFHYGTHERPLMEAVPRFHYRNDDLRELYDDLFESATEEVVSALRDEYELAELLDVARKARQPARPLLALADGTLIRWMIRGMRNHALEQQLIARYTAILADFRADGLPLASYISMPGNTEVVNLLRFFLGEPPDDTPDPETSLAGLTDRSLFGDLLQPGERSAIFESASHIQREYGTDRICYFYLLVPARHGPGEIGRVEIPLWVADDPALVDLVHATVLSECEKGDGYPMILSEAHERAVIRAHERQLFYDLIEREMRQQGLRFDGSRKAASKRRPPV